MSKITVWGFSGSTLVRTIRMVLAEKGVTDYEQVPVNVLKGEPKSAEHLQRHPFGKVPVVDVDGFRLIETPAIARYLDAVLAYHLFPDFVGGKNEKAHHEGLETGKKVLGELMRIKGGSRYIAGEAVSVADLYLAPLLTYVAMTPHKDEFMALPGVQAWWESVSGRDSFTATKP